MTVFYIYPINVRFVLELMPALAEGKDNAMLVLNGKNILPCDEKLLFVPHTTVAFVISSVFKPIEEKPA